MCTGNEAAYRLEPSVTYHEFSGNDLRKAPGEADAEGEAKHGQSSQHGEPDFLQARIALIEEPHSWMIRSIDQVTPPPPASSTD